jgi:hypothetical protein
MIKLITRIATTVKINLDNNTFEGVVVGKTAAGEEVCREYTGKTRQHWAHADEDAKILANVMVPHDSDMIWE